MRKVGARSARAAQRPAVVRGFTLVELLITITIIATLVVIVVIIVNPGEIFKRTRDTRRIADLATPQDAFLTYLIHSPIADMDGSNLVTCADEASPSAYVSIPKSVAMHAPPPGWAWKQVEETSLTRLDGTGWVPLAISSVSIGDAIGRLPVDPVNKSEGTTRFFYTYGCKRSGTIFEVNAKLESKDFGPGGVNDLSRGDGGDVVDVYEIGKTTGILPATGIY